MSSIPHLFFFFSDREVIKKRSRDPMYKLEHGVEDTKKLKSVIPTLSQIEDMQDAWKDDYMQNKMLRNKFRVSN